MRGFTVVVLLLLKNTLLVLMTTSDPIREQSTFLSSDNSYVLTSTSL